MSQLQAIHGKYYYVLESGRSGNLWTQILSHLQQQRLNLEQVYSVDHCDVILVLCLITSRAGTDIDAALKKLNDLSALKPAIFLVLHYTFDPERVVLDSSRVVKRMDTLTVDCLFYDRGLLQCKINDDALDKIVMHFKHQVSKEKSGASSFLIRSTSLLLSIIGPLWNKLPSFILQSIIGPLWNRIFSFILQNKKRHDGDEDVLKSNSKEVPKMVKDVDDSDVEYVRKYLK